MTYLTTLTQKWQMTLPKAVREQLGIDTPGRVTVRVVDKKKNLVTIEKTPDILDLAGRFVPKKMKPVMGAREAMEKGYKRF